MGQVLGIFAKNKKGIIYETPIYAEEESFYSLANIFLNPKPYISSVLENSKIEDPMKNGLQLTDEEEIALLYNNVQDFADDEIQHKHSINQPLPEKFRAIKMKYIPEKGEIIYSNEYSKMENWSNIKTISQALYKIKEVLYRDLKLSIQNGEDEDYKKYSYDNIQILCAIIKMMKTKENAEEIALVYAPN